MSVYIDGKTVTMTRGDTAIITVEITDQRGEAYQPAAGDQIRFAMKRNISDPRPVISKDIDPESRVLRIESSETKSLPFGRYQYDVQLTTAGGIVDTFIAGGSWVLTEEVD